MTTDELTLRLAADDGRRAPHVGGDARSHRPDPHPSRPPEDVQAAYLRQLAELSYRIANLTRARDDLIRDAYAAGIPGRVLAAAAGLTQPRIVQIAGPRPPRPDRGEP